MKNTGLLLFISVFYLLACNKPVTRKVVIMGRGKLHVDNGKIIMTDGAGYVETHLDIEGSEPSKWQIITPKVNTEITVPEEKGMYILNLKADTIIGSLQLIGVDINNGRVTTQEELKMQIDSLMQLTKGENVFFGSRNYFIIPGQLAKISPNIKANIYGPYKLIPYSIESEDRMPEIISFIQIQICAS